MIFDFMVIGGGISGAAAADALAARGSVILLEAESAPGYHSTGRSAALFTPLYGGATVRAVTTVSRGFFENPPDGFADAPLLSPPRGALAIAAPGNEAALQDTLALSTERDPVTAMAPEAARELVPYLRPELISAVAWEPGVADIDVAALHQGFLRRFGRRGGEIRTGFRVEALVHHDGVWTARSRSGAVAAKVVVNAAGAWADQVGALAGARPIGLVPKRRSAILIDVEEAHGSARLPVVDFAGEPNYIKPETGRLMVSPGDETPVEPQDIQTDDFEIAVLVDWLEKKTRLSVRRIARQWAGLRSFVADQAPVAGFDDHVPGFFWLAGQGGFGIMMSPALAELSAGLIADGAWPESFTRAGITPGALAPARCRAG